MASVDEDLADDPETLGASLTGIPGNLMGLAKQTQIDDTTKAGLLGFAFRMLSGGWGTPGQQLAGALGAGAESAGAQEAIQTEKTQKEADRKNRLDIAKTGAASREEIQRMRDETTRAVTTEKIAGALERQALRSGPKNMDEMQWILKEKTRLGTVLKNQIKEMGLDKDAAENWIHMKAEENLAKRRASGSPTGGGPAKLGAPGSETPDPAATTPSKTPGKGSAAPTTPGAAPPGVFGADAAWEAIKKNPDFEKAFADPNERAKLRKKGYGAQVDAEEKKRNLSGGGGGLMAPGPTPISDWLKGLFAKPPPGVVEEGREHIK